MVVTKNPDRRWCRRYRTFFIIGILILGFQIYLTINFLSIHNDTTDNKWNPHKILLESSDFDNSANSARRARDGFLIDDEDVLNNNFINNNFQKPKNVKTSSTNEKKVPHKIKPNLTLLRVEELDFVPWCNITTKEAVSAIHRAKTQKCKQELVSITCKAQQGLLYPKVLPNFCPNSNFVAGKSLGCYKDEKTFRLLSGYYARFKTNNSPSYCIGMCLQSGFPYAGVQYSTECFCGNDEPPNEARLPDSSCNMKCPADPHEACGGYLTINIYQTGITKFIPQVAQISEEKDKVAIKPVRIVFLLTLNGRAVRQVRRLIKILFHKKHYFYIHVDARQDYLFRELLPLEKQFPNIRLTRRRFATIWGGASLLRMLLASMQELLHTNWQWDFIINLSESDFPVKTLNQLEEFLSANRDKNFVKSHGREVQRFMQKQGLDKTFVECDAHMWRQGDRQLPFGIQIDGGSDWVALSKPFVSYVASQNPDELVEGLKTVFKYTLLPAESFFHTVLRNSKFCNTYVDNNLHVTNWKRKLGCKCQYKHVVDWCGCSPNDFKPDDWLRIQGTENKQLYFARKFEPIINQAIILQVEEWLHGPSPANTPNIHSYWQSVYNHADLSPSPDDATISISTSIARITAKTMSAKLNKNHELEYNKLIEVTSYHKNDNYEGTLIMYEINSTDGRIILETLVQPKEHVLLTKTGVLSQRLQQLIVSSDYDQKEQISRNFGRMLGPFSEPVLVYQFLPSLANSAKTHNVSFLWIDPTGQLVDISEASIDEAYVIGHVKPTLKQPILPGSWSVILIQNKQIIGQCSFLIVPLEFMSNVLLTQTQVTFVHSGSIITKEFDSHWNTFLASDTERDNLMRKSVSNAKRFGYDLSEWIDVLVAKFYKIQRTCIVSNTPAAINVSFNQLKLEFCNKTSWSSLAADPKSQIGLINETTGYIHSLW